MRSSSFGPTLRVFTGKEALPPPPSPLPPRPFGSKRIINSLKACKMALKWETFPDESIKYKLSSRYGTTTYALDIHVSRPCLIRASQGVTKRCRLSLLTNSALVIQVQMRGEGGSCGVSANEHSSAHHVTWSPIKLWRSTYLHI
jgi:hypothetical protein